MEILKDKRHCYLVVFLALAVINFLRYTHFGNSTTYFGCKAEYDQKPVPPNGHASLWMEEARIFKDKRDERK